MPKRQGQSRTFAGSVVQKRVSPGSKSDRVAVLLKTRGRELILRRKDGNPFKDEVLEGLVGKRIAATGVLAGKILIMKGWEEEEGQESERTDQKANSISRKPVTSSAPKAQASRLK